MNKFLLISVFGILTFNVMAQEKICLLYTSPLLVVIDTATVFEGTAVPVFQ